MQRRSIPASHAGAQLCDFFLYQRCKLVKYPSQVGCQCWKFKYPHVPMSVLNGYIWCDTHLRNPERYNKASEWRRGLLVSIGSDLLFKAVCINFGYPVKRKLAGKWPGSQDRDKTRKNISSYAHCSDLPLENALSFSTAVTFFASFWSWFISFREDSTDADSFCVEHRP